MLSLETLLTIGILLAIGVEIFLEWQWQKEARRWHEEEMAQWHQEVNPGKEKKGK